MWFKVNIQYDCVQFVLIWEKSYDSALNFAKKIWGKNITILHKEAIC